MDFSKKGEVTNTALFAGRNVLQKAADAASTVTSNPAPSYGVWAVDKADTVAEQLGTDLLPGDSSTKFFMDHFKSMEVEGNVGSGLKLLLGECSGLDTEITNKLATGGKIERQTDPVTGKTSSWDVTGYVGGSTDINADRFYGIPGISEVKSKAGNAHGGLTMEDTFHIPVNENGIPDPSKIEKDVSLKVNMGMEVNPPGILTNDGIVKDHTTTRGVEFEGSISIENLLKLPKIPAEYRKEMKEAYDNGQYDKLKQLCARVLPDIKFEGNVETFERTNAAVKGNIDVKEGVGGGVEGTAGMEYISTTSTHEGSITIDSEGIHTEGASYKDGIKDYGTEKPYDISWQDIAGGLEKYAPAIEQAQTISDASSIKEPSDTEEDTSDTIASDTVA